jgi:hypothetical protein
MTTKFRTQTDGKALIPLEPVDLPTGQVLEVETSEATEPRRGSPEALLKLMRELPPISAEAVNELERAIEEGQLPLSYENIFGDSD